MRFAADVLLFVQGVVLLIGAVVIGRWVQMLKSGQRYLDRMAAMFEDDSPLMILHTEAIAELDRRLRRNGQVDPPPEA